MREETSMREGKDLDHTLLDSILQAITTCFGIDNIIIKKHPRDTTPNQNEYTYYKYNGLPFESICMNSNISSKLIVVVRSTAAITPKLLLDQEPRVIATYKIMGDYTEKKDRLYRACKSLYRNPERFMIPENMEELAEALQECKNAGFDKVSSHE